jgi:hypothetical protein
MVNPLVLFSKYVSTLTRIDRSMTRDEKVYPDAESFKPERFIKDGTLDKEARDPRDIVFGFGRRCVLSFILSSKPILFLYGCL